MTETLEKSIRKDCLKHHRIQGKTESGHLWEIVMAIREQYDKPLQEVKGSAARFNKNNPDVVTLLAS